MSENRDMRRDSDGSPETRSISDLHDEFPENIENVENTSVEEQDPFEPITKKESKIKPLPEERLTAEEIEQLYSDEDEEYEYEEENSGFMETLKKVAIALVALAVISLLGVLLFVGINSGRSTPVANNNGTGGNPSLNPTVNTPGTVNHGTANPSTIVDDTGTEIGIVDNVEETAAPKREDEVNQIIVEDLTAMSLDEAKEFAKENDVEIKVEQKQSTAKEGTILSQDPKANSKISSGDTVTVTVSAGGAYALTDMTDTTLAKASSILKENNIKYTVQECYSSKASGLIMSQSPKTGEISSGSTVKFVVSKGLPNVLNLRGHQSSEFKGFVDDLKAGCLNVSMTTEYEETSEVLPDTIADIRVDGNSVIGKPAYEGEKFVVVLAKHPTAYVQNYAGWDIGKVKDWMFNTGFKTHTIKKYSTDVKEGIVISNDPANVQLQKGNYVTIYVSKGEYEAYDFTGKPYSYLQKEIDKAISEGAKVNVVTTYQESDKLDSGWIISQEQVGSTVNVVISSGKAKSE